ncbi:hypothetical protein [Methylobacterium currus]|uniref:hypothetical protein n=1 Tax=Methylobacterium currus TaxID=2051553 RepID=UPI000F4E8006|nr:hypothetical protein [Methylobacterium currus]
MRDFDPDNPPETLFSFAGPKAVNRVTPKRAIDNSEDIKIIDFWIEKNKVSPHLQREAREVYTVFQQLVGKPFRQCKRADGLKLSAHYESLSLSGPPSGRRSGTCAQP